MFFPSASSDRRSPATIISDCRNTCILYILFKAVTSDQRCYVLCVMCIAEPEQIFCSLKKAPAWPFIENLKLFLFYCTFIFFINNLLFLKMLCLDFRTWSRPKKWKKWWLRNPSFKIIDTKLMCFWASIFVQSILT